MSDAPVCNINPPAPTAEPQVSSLPAIPVATDLASALRAINTISQIIQAMTNQNSDNSFPQKPIISTKKDANFHEVVARRIIKKMKITDPNDSSVFVEVKQITGLTFLNKVTGQAINWKQ